MSNEEQKIAQLEQEVRVSQELLFLVLDQINEPVVIDVLEAKNKSMTDRRIDVELDEKAGTWTLQVVDAD